MGKLSVLVLAKFSKQSLVQQQILAYGDEILRILSLIDFVSFVSIAYNLLSTPFGHVMIGDTHWQQMQKYIQQNIETQYEEEQLDVIWSLIAMQNEKSFSKEKSFLNDQQMNDLFAENIKVHGLERVDVQTIAKSKQILAHQAKTECVLTIESFVRCANERRRYKQICAVSKVSEEQQIVLINESSVQLSAIQQQNMTQNQTIIQQQREIKRLQQKTIDQAKEEKINKNEIERMRQEQLVQSALIEEQQREIEALKQRHLIDKQQFAQNMMSEMNNLRNELRRMGKLQLAQHRQFDKQKRANLESKSYFGTLW